MFRLKSPAANRIDNLLRTGSPMSGWPEGRQDSGRTNGMPHRIRTPEAAGFYPPFFPAVSLFLNLNEGRRRKAVFLKIWNSASCASEAVHYINTTCCAASLGARICEPRKARLRSASCFSTARRARQSCQRKEEPFLIDREAHTAGP